MCRPSLLLMLLMLLMSGCATLPSQEMSDARQAIAAALEAGAQAHAPATLNLAETILQDAQTALQAGDYNSSRAAALEAHAAAVEAREISLEKQSEQ